MISTLKKDVSSLHLFAPMFKLVLSDIGQVRRHLPVPRDSGVEQLCCANRIREMHEDTKACAGPFGVRADA